jgi:hypothetical protein
MPWLLELLAIVRSVAYTLLFTPPLLVQHALVARAAIVGFAAYKLLFTPPLLMQHALAN